MCNRATASVPSAGRRRARPDSRRPLSADRLPFNLVGCPGGTPISLRSGHLIRSL
jgi:hypothetical protein